MKTINLINFYFLFLINNNNLDSNNSNFNKKINIKSIEIYYVDPYQLTFTNVKSVSNFFKQFKNEIYYIKINNNKQLNDFSNFFISSEKEKINYSDIRYVIKVNFKNSKSSEFIYGCRFTLNVNNENFKIPLNANNYILSLIENDLTQVAINHRQFPINIGNHFF